MYSYTLDGTPIRIILNTRLFFFGCSRSPGRFEVEHWPADIAVSGSRPLVAEISLSINEIIF